MKILSVALFLVLLSGCNGGGDSSGKVNPGSISSDQIAQAFIKDSQNTLDPELKLQSSELEELEKEGFVTSEEKNQILENI